MEGVHPKRLTAFWLLLCSCAIMSFAQEEKTEQKDSLVRLLKGSSVQMVTPEGGESYRKAKDATFFHNNTLLICDSAFWYVDRNIIEAMGNVQLQQKSTKLTSERLDYFVDDDLARFRGGIVQLEDTARNVLRTKILDYNTKDSVAIFEHGGAMRDKKGQIIESVEGTYDSKAHMFTFNKSVNMFTDSIFIKTESLEYNSNTAHAVFTSYIDFWSDDNMLSAAGGWYDKDAETFFFTGKVHGLSKNQETWSDSLYYYQNTKDVHMQGSAQVQADNKGTAAFADDIYYVDSLARITLTRRAAGAVITGKDDQKDTLYAKADTIVYQTRRMCEISDAEKGVAEQRLTDMLTDPVGEYIKAAAEAALKKAEEAKAKMAEGTRDLGEAGATPKKAKPESGKPALEKAAPAAESAPADTTVQTDSTAQADTTVHLDSTKVGFAMAFRNVLMFRHDMQVKCDSMCYTDLDSIARFYLDPTVWNEGRRQYTSDSLFTLVRGGKMDRSSLLSNAFVATQNDTLHYDQIKGAEILALFDTSAALTRFDALGGALALFYVKENDALSTINKVETKMLSGTFYEGQIDKMRYYDAPKNNAFPIVQVSKEDKFLKGFSWREEFQPKCKEDITHMEYKPSERSSYLSHPQPKFVQTDIYFPGYIDGINKAIARSKKAKEDAAELKRHQKEAGTVDIKEPSDTTRVPIQDSLLRVSSDSLAVTTDSLATQTDTLAAVADSIAAVTDSLAADSDSLAIATDSLFVSTDSLAAQEPVDSVKLAKLLEKERKIYVRDSIRLAKRAELEAKIAERDSIKFAHWAQLDSLDSLKTVALEQQKLEKKRENTRKALLAQLKQDKQDAQKFDKYVKKYTKQKEKQDGKNSRKVSKIRSNRHPKQRDERDPAIKLKTDKFIEPASEGTPESWS